MTASLALGPAPDVPLARINPVAALSALVVVTVVLLTSLDVVTPAVVVAAELALLPAAGLHRPAALGRPTRRRGSRVGSARYGFLTGGLGAAAGRVVGAAAVALFRRARTSLVRSREVSAATTPLPWLPTSKIMA